MQTYRLKQHVVFIAIWLSNVQCSLQSIASYEAAQMPVEKPEQFL